MRTPEIFQPVCSAMISPGRSCRLVLTYAVTISALALSRWSAEATPYATSLANAGSIISFRLNEAADNVAIVSSGGTVTNNLGARPAGVNSAALSITGTYKIVVTKAGTGTVGPIAANIPFFAPRGVTVNVNPASPYFGRIYVANGNTNASGKGDGIFVFSPDMTDTFGQGLAPRTGGITNFSLSGNSPYRVKVGRGDDRLYICDFSDASGNLYSTDPDVGAGSGVYVLKSFTTNGNGTSTAIVPVGLDNNHGSLQAVEAIGSAQAGTLKIFTLDEDYQPDPTSTVTNQINSLWQYDVGAGPTPWSNAPNAKLLTPTIGFVAQTMDLARNTNGLLYISNNRFAGNEPCLYIVSTNGALIFDSLTQSLSDGSPVDVLSNSVALAVSPDARFLAVVNSSCQIVIVPLTNGIPNLGQRFQYSGLSSTNGAFGLAFDTANNLYVTAANVQILAVLGMGYDSVAATSSDGTFFLAAGPPLISTQPQDRTNTVGTGAVFTLAVNGSAPFTYQWRFNGTNLVNGGLVSGANGNTLNLSSAQLSNAGNYDVVVANSYGTATSSVAVLTVTNLPTYTGVLAGWDVSSLTGFGPSPFAPTTNAPNLSVVGLTRGSGLGTNGAAAVRAWGANTWPSNVVSGLATNQFATFTLTPSNGYSLNISNFSRFDYRRSLTGPTNGLLQYQLGAGSFIDITNVEYTSNSSAGASLGPIDLSGIPALKNIPSGTAVTFRLINYNATNPGGTWYVFDVSNTSSNDLEISGSLVPPGANTPPTITAQPVNFAVVRGSNATFSVAATGLPAPAYQWLRNGTNILGATSATFTLTNVQSTNAGVYSVRVSNVAGSVNSVGAFLLVLENSYTCDGRVCLWPTPPAAGTPAGVRYSAVGGPLASSSSVNLYYSWNNWSFGAITVPMTFNSASNVWETTITPPNVVTQLDCVFNDGSGTWDNNGSLDWHFAVANSNQASAFVMDGVVDSPGFLVATNNGLSLYAALNGTKLYVATTSPGTNGPNDHFIFLTDQRLSSASAAAPWSKAGLVAVDPAKPMLGGESGNNFTGWFNAPGAIQSGKSATIGGVMEGVIDLALNFGATPTNLYLCAAAYQTADGGGLVAQCPAGSGPDIDPGEFLSIPLSAVPVPAAPVLTSQPQSRTNDLGSSAGFSVSASGTAPLNYRWQLNGINLMDGGRIAGSQSNTLYIANVQAGDFGNYRVIVSNPYGSATSQVATLSVPSWVVNPFDSAVEVGPGIQNWHVWYQNNPAALQSLAWDSTADARGKTNSGAMKVTAQFGNSGQFAIYNGTFFTSLNGSNYATLEMDIRFDPSSPTRGGGDFGLLQFGTETGPSNSFGPDWFGTVAIPATNTGWVHVSAPINPGADVLQREIRGIIIQMDGNFGGNQLNGTTVFWVDNVALTLNPVAQTNLSLSVDPSLTWVGFMNRYDLPSDGGTYQGGDIWPTADLSAGFVGSTVTLAPNTSIARDFPPPNSFWWKPDGSGNKKLEANFYSENQDWAGRTVNFSGYCWSNSLVSAYSSVAFIKHFSLDYQAWVGTNVLLSNGQPFSVSLPVPPGRIVQIGFATTGPNASLTNAPGLGSVILSSNPPPAMVTIATQPLNRIAVQGSSASVSVTAFGAAPVGYQWRFNGTNLAGGGQYSGASSNILLINSVQAGNAGNYDVIITNSVGSVTSAVANVSVVVPPDSRNVVAGGRVTFSATAVGAGPFSYQWSFNSASIAAATNSILTLVNVQASNAGTYAVTVSSLAGSVSTSATLGVSPNSFLLSQTNLIVLRVGDGAQTLSATGNSAFLDQFTTAGGYLNTVSVPDSGANGVVMSGNSFVEGYLSRSLNGRLLSFAAYGTNVGAGVNITTSTNIPRVVATFDGASTFNRAVVSTNDFRGAAFRSAVTDGTNNFWGTGPSNGVIYLGNNAPRVVVENAKTNCRVVQVFNGNLYMSSGSIGGDGRTGIYKFGGLPTTAVGLPPAIIYTNTFTSLNGVTDFAVNPAETTVYFADDRAPNGIEGGVQRWDFNAASNAWFNTYHLTNGLPGVGVSHLAVDWSGGSPVIYAVTAVAAATNQNTLVKVTDTGVASSFTTLASAGPSQIFRGVKFGPVSDPPTIVAQPQSQTNSVNTTAMFTVGAAGSGTLNYRWQFAATNTAIHFGGDASAESSGYDQTVGWDFTPTTDVTIIRLGFYDYGRNGLVSSHRVGLWTADGTMLVQTNIPPGTNTFAEGDFRYVGIPPTTLTGGQTYVVGAELFINDADWFNGADSVSYLGIDARLTGIHNRYGSHGTSFQFPGSIGLPNVGAYFGPNFQLSATSYLSEGGRISGAQTPTLTITNVQMNDAGAYRALVTNAFGSVTSLAASLTVTQLSGGVTLGNLSQTFNGGPHPVPVTTAPTGLVVNVSYNGLPAAPTNVGSYTVVGHIADLVYTGAITNTFNILPASPTITWTNPAPINYSAALTASQLNASANVPGSFVYSLLAGAILNAGTNQISAIFTPADTTNYNSVTNFVSLVVLRAPLTVTVSNVARLVGETNPVFTGTLVGLTNADIITATYSTTATTNSPPGNYPIVPTLVDPGSRLANYTVTTNVGTLSVVTCITSPQGLVTWWPMDGNGNDVVGTNNAIQMVGVSFEGGKVGQSLRLNGQSNYVNFGSGASVTGTGPFAIEFWLRTTNLSEQAVICQRSPQVFNGEYVLRLFSGYLVWFTFGDNQFGFNFSGTQNVADGNWHHVVVTREPNGAGRIWVDGTLDAEQSASARTLVPTDIFVGADYRDLVITNLPRYFKGNLDEISIYNRSLASNEVSSLFFAGAAGKCSGQVQPTIVQQPQSQSAVANGSALFGVNAVGSQPLAYRWFLNGLQLTNNAQISGAQNTNLLLSAVSTNYSGNYYVVVTNLFGSATSAVATLTVTRVAPGLAWGTPASISYGTPLGSNQLNATAAGAGIFSYTPSAASFLNVGTNLLSVIFTPSNPAIYLNATGSVSLVVTRAPLTVTANNATRAFGAANPLFSSAFTGLLSGDGISATFTSNAGTNSPPGNYPITLVALSDPNGKLGNYIVTTNSGILTVIKATPVVSWATPAPISYGTALGAPQLNATANVPGAFVYTPLAGTVLPVGTNLISVAFTPTDVTDFNGAGATVNQIVQIAGLTIVVSNATRFEGQTNPVFTGSIAGMRSGDNITATFASSTDASSPPGNYPITPVISDPNGKLGNYSVTISNGTLTVVALNDMFADRKTIPAVSNVFQSANLNATKEFGEPNHVSNGGGRSLWWTWTAPANGTVSLDTIGSSFDTLLAVYTGNSVSNLTLVANDDDSGGEHTSALTFQADPLVTYQIAVDGYNGATGSVVLRLVEDYGPPQFVFQPQGQSAVVGSPITLTASVRGSRPFSFQWRKDGVDIPGATNLFGATNTSLTLPSAQTNDSGSYTVFANNLYGSALSGAAALNIFLRPDNDAYGSATVVSGQVAHVTGNNVYATRDGFELALFAGRSVWWKWTAPTNGTVIVDTLGSSFDSVLGVYTNTLPNQGLMKSDDQSGGNNAARISFDTVAGVTYYLGVDGSQWASVFARTGSVALNLTMQFLPPQITAQPQGLSAELGWEAAFSVTASGTTPLSYQWRKNGSAIPGATNSTYAIASVQTGDDGNYSVVVSNAFGTVTSSNGALSIYTAPANDSFANRVTLTGLGNSTNGINVGATKEFSEPNHAGNQGGRSVWWSWTATTNGTVIMSTAGSTFDTLLAVYTGNSVAALTLVASDDNSAGNQASRVVFAATNGTTYQIAVDGSYPANLHGAAAGNIALSWAVSPQFAPLFLTQPQSLAVAAGNTVTLSASAAASPPPRYQWLKNGVPIAGKTNTTLQLPGVTTNQSGLYSVMASNSVGATPSELAQLRVQKAINPSYRGIWPGFQTGDAQDVAVENSLAYVATSAGFLILDVGDPFNPRRISDYNTESAATRIAESSGFVYLLTSSNQISPAKLSRFDARNPGQPRKIAEYTSTDARDFTLAGDYVAAIDGGILKVLTTNCSLLGSINSGNGIGGSIAASNDTVYVSWASSVRGYSLANPASPTLNFNLAQSPAQLAASENYLYNFSGGAQVVKLRILEPTNSVKVEVGTTVLSNVLGQASQQAITVSSNAAFVVTAGETGNGLGIYDLTQPGNPQLVGVNLFPDGSPRHLALENDYAYVANGGAGLKIFDVINHTNPVAIGQFFTAIQVNALALQGNRVFAMDRNNGFHIIDVTDSTSPQSLGFYQSTNGAAAIAIKSHYVYLAQDAPPTSITISGPGLQVVDVANPAAPQLLGSVTLPSPALQTLPQPGDPSVEVTALAVAGDIALVGSYVNGIAAVGVVDVSNPAAPRVVSRYDVPGLAQIKRIDFHGRYAYLADYNFGLRVLDLLDPANPMVAGGYFATSPTTSVSVSSNICLLTGDAGTMQLDVTNPANPIPLGTNNIVGTLDWLQSSLALGYGADGIKVFDLISVTNPLVLGQFVGSYRQVVVQGRYAFAAADEAGLTILDLGTAFNTAPAIIDQPADTRVAIGTTARFYVGAVGTMPLTYQWMYGGVDLPDETEPLLSLPNVQSDQAGQYSVVVANASGSVTSAVAALSVNLAPSVALAQPSDRQVFAPPAQIVLSADAEDFDGSVAQVQFLQDEVLVGTVTNSPFTMSRSNLSFGSYTFKARATDNEGATTVSASVVAVVTNQQIIQLSQSSYTVNEGGGVATIRVQRNFTGAASIKLYTLSGTAQPSVNGGAGAYFTISNTINFDPGALATNVDISLVNDLIYRSNRTFSVVLANPSATWNLVYPSNALVTVVDDELPSTINSYTDIVLPAPAPTNLASLQVSLTPTQALGSWRFNWEAQWRSGDSLAMGMVPGEHTIEFIPRSGFVTPPATNITIAAGTNSLAVVYATNGAPQSGALSVALSPLSIASGTNRAQWRLQGESGTNWFDSGAIIAGLPIGFHIAEFKPVDGYETPPAKLVSVIANFTNFNQATYSIAPSASGAGPVLLPSFAAISNGISAGLPYVFNGQLISEAGQGSGFVVKQHTVLTVAHAVFDAASLSFVSNIRWSLQRYAGEYDPTPLQPRGSFVLGGYATARTNDIISGLSPGESSLTSRNLDVAALWFADNADISQLPGRGGQGGYLVSDTTGTDWLSSSLLKLLVGYPIEQIANTNVGKMHQVGPGSFQFEAVTNQVYRSSDLKSYPGNSGGPLCVYGLNSLGQPFFIPAGVFLGGAGQTIVRAIDRDVVDLINQAEAQSAGGGNSTAGGVVRWAGDPSTAQGLIPAMFRVNLLPQGAFANPPGWRVSGTIPWITDYTGWYYLTNQSQFNNLVLEFNSAPGFITPATITTNMQEAPAVGTVRTATIAANYVPIPPAQLAVLPATGFSASGALGGPFTPTNVAFVITNAGGQDLNWLANKSVPWLTLSASSGTLAGSAATNITVALNTNANTLAGGIYTDTLTFNNLSAGGLGTTNRSVTLTVIDNSVPLRLTVPVKLADGSYRVTLTGTSNRTYAIQLSTNLLSWTNVLVLTNTTGTNVFTNTPAANSPKGYIRAMQTP